MKKDIENKWPAFEIKSWKSIPVIKGTIATENDAKEGFAVFCIKMLLNIVYMKLTYQNLPILKMKKPR
jgi:hypothetical protein